MIFKKNVNHAVKTLRKRLARSFSVLGKEHNFVLKINGQEIGIEDRDYFSKLQFIWPIGREDDYSELVSNGQQKEPLDSELKVEEHPVKISGWVGTFEKSRENKGENAVSILVRGKLAQANILNNIDDNRLFTKYLIGEVHADFLDTNDEG